LRLGAADYVNKYRDGGACMQVQSVLAKLSLCRTRALGGHELQCDACQRTCNVYNSCGDRHCPGCSGSKRYDFSERAEKVLLDGVDYYQVVFTLPSELSRLVLSNRQPLADLLFRTAWKSLRKAIRSEQGYDPAATMVLHTWNQKLESHWHVHAIVPGAGPAVKTNAADHQNSWQTSTAPPGSDLSDDHYLVDAIDLRTSFRKFALVELNRLRTRGELKLDFDPKHGDLRTDEGWKSLTDHLASLDWVSYIQPPPENSSGPTDLVRYLTRYLTGGPISDSRIESASEHNVTFMAREGNVQGGEQTQVPITLSTTEFVQRWCLHVQPDQLTKTRHFGGWSNSKLSAYQATCVQAMESANVPVSPEAMEFPPPEQTPQSESPRQSTCPHCEQAALRRTQSWPRPSWSDLFRHSSTVIPAWYRKSLEIDDEQFWDGAFGAGFNAWYLKTVVESAYASSPSPPARQMMLPGLERPSYDPLN